MLQGEPELPFSLDGLIQAAIVFFFIILPVLRGLTEMRKRRGAKGGGAGSAKGSAKASPSQRKPREVVREGRDLWRELLGGDESRTPQPGPPQTAPPKAAPPKAAARRAPAHPRVQVAPPAAEALRDHRPAERARPAEARAQPAAAPGRIGDRELGSLEVGVDPVSFDRLPSSMTAPRTVDPATLDDELGHRWGELAPTEVAHIERVEHLGGAIDWRRAVLLSELVSPPLALRGAESSWPGPPASLSR
jgi:hypothetical protein